MDIVGTCKRKKQKWAGLIQNVKDDEWTKNLMDGLKLEINYISPQDELT